MSATATEGSSSSPPRPWLLWILASLGALWLPTVNQLRFEWSVNAQYAYGWTVPFLALYLFTERWKSRPKTAPFRSGALLFITAIFAALPLLPLRLIQEASPDWRLVSWAMAGVSFSLSLCLLYFAGGWPWLKYFFFPIAFILIAVPWPMPIEKNLIQELMRIVTTISVEALGWCGIPATQQGNVISVTNGVVGVEEACSGVRSLQTGLMVSLFLGELFRFGIARRLALLAGGLVLAFCFNVGRSFLLVWLCASDGPSAVEKWHDLVGNSVLVLTLGGLAGFSLLLRGKTKTEAEEPPLALREFQPRLLSWRAVVVVLSWLLLCEGVTEWWYRAHESSSARLEMWSVKWPESRPKFREVKLAEATRAMLLYNEARSATWADPDQSQWSMVFIRWLAGRVSAQLAKSHGPELCLPGAGATMVADLGIRPVKIHDLDLPMHVYVFSLRSKSYYVFYCLWEDYSANDRPKSSRERMTYARRFEAVRDGRRNKGQQVLEFSVSGYSNIEDAEKAAHRFLAETIAK